MNKSGKYEHREKLVKYLKTLKKTEKEEFADAVGLSLGGIQQIAYGLRPCRVRYAVRIDRYSNGAVPFTYLCPTVDWAHVVSVGRKRLKAEVEAQA